VSTSPATHVAISRSRTRVLYIVLPFVIIIGLWYAVALVFSGLRVIPTPLAVVQAFIGDLAVYPVNVGSTLGAAAIGYVVGNVLALILGVVFVQVPWVERLLLRIGVASFCIPLVAIAPILVVVLSGSGPKIALAALSVFFTTLIAVILGLRAVDGSSTEVIRSLGGTSWQVMFKIRLFAMLPSTFAGLQIAAPAAILGAIIGEYLGASEGLGVMLVLAQSSFEVARTWAIALVMSALAGLAYGLVGLIGRRLTPWAAHDVTVGVGAVPSSRQGSRVHAFFNSVLGLAGSVVIVVLGWYLLIRAFNLNSYFAKTPLDIFEYLVTDAVASANRERLWEGLVVTLGDAAVGYVVGMVAAVLIALLVVTSSLAETVIMPGSIVLRSIPLVALTPLLALVFGRGLLGTTVIVALVTFFITLVNVTVGLRSAPQLCIDLVKSLGGSVAFSTRKVRFLYALPSIFASAKIAVPGALAGATLAEWLATGRGLGSMIISDFAASQFASLWTESLTIVAVSVFFYAIIAAIEKPIVRRFGAAPIER